MENKSEKFQNSSFTSYGGDKGNEFKSEWPAEEELPVLLVYKDSAEDFDNTIHLLSFEVQAKYWKEKYKALKSEWPDKEDYHGK